MGGGGWSVADAWLVLLSLIAVAGPCDAATTDWEDTRRNELHQRLPTVHRLVVRFFGMATQAGEAIKNRLAFGGAGKPPALP